MEFINLCRLKAHDFEVVKVIGRGAFGEVQLVGILDLIKIFPTKIDYLFLITKFL